MEKGRRRRWKEGLRRRVRRVVGVREGFWRVEEEDGGVGGAEGRKSVGRVARVDCEVCLVLGGEQKGKEDGSGRTIMAT